MASKRQSTNKWVMSQWLHPLLLYSLWLYCHFSLSAYQVILDKNYNMHILCIKLMVQKIMLWPLCARRNKSQRSRARIRYFKTCIMFTRGITVPLLPQDVLLTHVSLTGLRSGLLGFITVWMAHKSNSTWKCWICLTLLTYLTTVKINWAEIKWLQESCQRRKTLTFKYDCLILLLLTVMVYVTTSCARQQTCDLKHTPVVHNFSSVGI